VPDRKYKILVVDDEEPMVEIVEGIVACCGHETLHAYSGEQAVTVARDSRPDAVLTGIMMACGDGVWEAEQIRQFLPDCRIILISSALHNPELRELLIRDGFDERLMLVKPFESAQLVELLNVVGIPSVLRQP
jgi:CheY-like chemotaxis protein